MRGDGRAAQGGQTAGREEQLLLLHVAWVGRGCRHGRHDGSRRHEVACSGKMLLLLLLSMRGRHRNLGLLLALHRQGELLLNRHRCRYGRRGCRRRGSTGALPPWEPWGRCQGRRRLHGGLRADRR